MTDQALYMNFFNFIPRDEQEQISRLLASQMDMDEQQRLIEQEQSRFINSVKISLGKGSKPVYLCIKLDSQFLKINLDSNPNTGMRLVRLEHGTNNELEIPPTPRRVDEDEFEIVNSIIGKINKN